MANFTIRPINTGYVPTYPKQYHYHHSVYKYIQGISDEKEALPVLTFLIEGDGKKILVDTGMAWDRARGQISPPGFLAERRRSHL